MQGESPICLVKGPATVPAVAQEANQAQPLMQPLSFSEAAAKNDEIAKMLFHEKQNLKTGTGGEGKSVLDGEGSQPDHSSHQLLMLRTYRKMIVKINSAGYLPALVPKKDAFWKPLLRRFRTFIKDQVSMERV